MKNTQFNTIRDLIQSFPTEQDCIDYLEEMRWHGNVVSPFDASSKVYKCKNNQYRCKNTGKYFNVKTGTMYENSNIKLIDWFIAVWLCVGNKKGISSLQLSREIGVTQKTAWFMLQRIRESFKESNESELSEEVEMDETFVGGKNKNRHKDKKVKNSQGRSFKDKTPVFGMVQRNGKMVAKVVMNTSAEQLTPIIQKYVNLNSIIYTDEWHGYKEADKMYEHYFVDHASRQYVNGTVTTNRIEGAWGILKRMIIGIYHYTSRKHLQRYVDEFVFRYNTMNESQFSRFNLFLCSTRNRLTYKQLVYGR